MVRISIKSSMYNGHSAQQSYYQTLVLLLIAFFSVAGVLPLAAQTKGYWNKNTQLLPWRMPIDIQKKNLRFIDLDKDGDPDLLYYTIYGDINVVWIDDDDDMKYTDTEGDADSDCLLIDRNKDGIFAGPMDISIDWCDEDGDGKADLQVIVNNGSTDKRGKFDFDSDVMYVFDTDQDGIMHYIDWNRITMLGWEHTGHANFYEDYIGNTSFIKMHASSFRVQDLRYSWENPFLFYDTDNDGLTEMSIRFVNTPNFRSFKDPDSLFTNIDTAYDVHVNGKMDYAAISWDLDNDNGPGNEFDFDMSLLFKGPGFDYRDQKHQFKSLKGLGKQAEFLFYDKRWRQLDELIYPDKDNAWPSIFKKANWNYCSLVFDEDDDCNRWERVEFYEPRDLFAMGGGKGGLDNNLQADVIGDRGEFDTDFSGKGKLYIGAFDGRIHLYGAEWGAWRIDQTAYAFQGYGGLYDRWRGKGRMQQQPEKFALVKYEDTDNNGFFDKVLYDLEGDKVFEDSVLFKNIGIDDRQLVFNSAEMSSKNAEQRFKDLADKDWDRAQQALNVASRFGLATHWYNFYKKPLSSHQKYEYAFWLNFYIYQDLRCHFKLKNDKKLTSTLDKAYYSGDWSLLSGK